MKKEIEEQMSVCLLHNCSACCNPVKIDYRVILVDSLPFIETGEILVPEKDIDYTKLRVFQCKNFNNVTGLCNDYFNRPSICKNTICPAFKTNIVDDQLAIINSINSEKFLHLPARRCVIEMEIADV